MTLLLAAGADVNRANNDGFSPLYEALMCDNEELAAVLSLVAYALAAVKSTVHSVQRTASRSTLLPAN